MDSCDLLAVLITLSSYISTSADLFISMNSVVWIRGEVDQIEELMSSPWIALADHFK